MSVNKMIAKRNKNDSLEANIVKNYEYRKLWRDMNVHVLKGHNT